jgi:hypothetical protein
MIALTVRGALATLVAPRLPEALLLLLTLNLPRCNDLMTAAVVEALHAAPGTMLPTGSKLVDVRVDLSGVAPHDCPPISHYRLVLREPAWLRALAVGVGDLVATDALVAQFSSEPDESLTGAPARPVRITIAGILPAVDDWGDPA